jgi:hypothetical protein
MSLVSVRAEIARFFDENLTGVHVFEHGGAFSVDDIKRYSKKSPAAVVTCLNVPNLVFQGTVVSADAQFGVFCLAAESSKEKRDIAALLLAESIAVETYKNFWFDSATSAPSQVNASNLYNSALDKMGIALWVVRWNQQVDLQRNVIATIDDFLTADITYDIGETEDTALPSDIVELEQ